MCDFIKDERYQAFIAEEGLLKFCDDASILRTVSMEVLRNISNIVVSELESREQKGD